MDVISIGLDIGGLPAYGCRPRQAKPSQAPGVFREDDLIAAPPELRGGRPPPTQPLPQEPQEPLDAA